MHQNNHIENNAMQLPSKVNLQPKLFTIFSPLSNQIQIKILFQLNSPKNVDALDFN